MTTRTLADGSTVTETRHVKNPDWTRENGWWVLTTHTGIRIEVRNPNVLWYVVIDGREVSRDDGQRRYWRKRRKAQEYALEAATTLAALRHATR